MLALGTPMPSFSLLDSVSNTAKSPSDFVSKKAMVVMFICNHCPFVVHINDGLFAFGRDYADKDVAIVAISANDAMNYPADAPDEMAKMGYSFPYLFDETQETAKAFKAACTPDFYVFDADRHLAYRGAFDDARPGRDVAVDGKYLRGAVDAVLSGAAVPEDQVPSIGCNIKWKPGNAPAYFAR